MELITPEITPPLEDSYRPAVLANRSFCSAVNESGGGLPLRILLERGGGATSVFDTYVFAAGHPREQENLRYVERLVKFLLWQRGGWRVVIGGPQAIAEHIKQVYSPGGARAFDYEFMGNVYGHRFTVEACGADEIEDPKETAVAVGRHTDGCRIGFDAGASDWKVAAVIDGESVFSTETPWDPRNNSDWRYHYGHINNALKLAASKMPHLDGIGVSSAGIYIDNQAMAASLFRGVPKADFEEHVKPIFLNIQKEWGVPLEVANDGDVTALAGSMSLGVNRVLGIAMGSSEAAGYVDASGNITGWLNELAFAPVDYSPSAPVDEWSGDSGVGALYFSQQAAIRLAPKAGIALKEGSMPGDKLAEVQQMMKAGDERAAAIFESIGVYLGYTVAEYASFYDLAHVLVLGRVTSGEGGHIILDTAKRVLEKQFPDLDDISVNLPDEKSRRVGQAVAAASLPEVATA
ncbi:MAG: ROK family protein [Armatimonadetes bacterium]|nr:ROK family protein [Armatimonadota bacterium]